MPKIRTNLINPISPDRAEFLADHVIAYDDGVISALRPYDLTLDRDAENALDCMALPGFIDLHVHLSQYRARGRFEPALLPWLEKHIFPAEALSAHTDYALEIAKDFFRALFAAGTTTTVIYTAPFRQACQAAFEVAEELGARALIGMTLMDRNSPDALLHDTSYAYENSVALRERWHDRSTLLDYIFTPRFAPTCSTELMKLIGEYASAQSAFIQSHLSENKDEIAWVKELFGKASYTQVYADLGILGPHTIMGHAIHLSEEEIAILAETQTAIAHCPDSNFFLKSGEFPYQRLWDAGLRIGLGSDVGAGTTLSMPHHAQMANYRQSACPLSPPRLLWHLTMASAAILGWQERIGSLELGKDADLCVFRIPEGHSLDAGLLSSLFFYGAEFKTCRCIVRGRTVYSQD